MCNLLVYFKSSLQIVQSTENFTKGNKFYTKIYLRLPDLSFSCSKVSYGNFLNDLIVVVSYITCEEVYLRIAYPSFSQLGARGSNLYPPPTLMSSWLKSKLKAAESLLNTVSF